MTGSAFRAVALSNSPEQKDECANAANLYLCCMQFKCSLLEEADLPGKRAGRGRGVVIHVQPV